MIFTYHPNDFWHKRKIYNFDPYSVFATNRPQRLKTGFVLQGHISWPFNIIKLDFFSQNVHSDSITPLKTGCYCPNGIIY